MLRDVRALAATFVLVCVATSCGSGGKTVLQPSAHPPAGGAVSAAPIAAGQQSQRWIPVSDRTMSTQWRYVDRANSLHPGTPMRVPSVGLLTVVVNANVRGAAVQFRVLDNVVVAKPKIATFTPTQTSRSFSFTFSHFDQPKTCGHTIRLEWRSPTGHRVDLDSASVIATFVPPTNATTPCP